MKLDGDSLIPILLVLAALLIVVYVMGRAYKGK